MRRILLLWILILLAKDSTAELTDFIYLERGTQTIGTVTSISDGDTIKVELPGTETKVRLLSIDTPELPDEPYAQEAKNFTTQELLNQPIKLIYSNNPEYQKDKYERLLAVVVKDDEIFNLKLLEQGLAVRMFMFNDIIKFPAWEDVEINARQQKANIWSKINSQGIFINEINPNPYPEADNEAEFVELYNHNSTPVNVGSWTFISIYNQAVIPPGTIIPANGYLIIASNTTKFKSIYPTTPPQAMIIEVGGNLILRNSYKPKENLVIHLLAQDKSYQDSLTYNLDWDNKGANGTGKTLERKSFFKTNVGDSEVGGLDDDNWDASNNPKGTPGTINFVSSTGVDVASWIISCQRSTGAICTAQSMTQIIPYKANIAAMGLLEKDGYEGYVKVWIEWYFTHLETSGTIYDYKVENDLEVSLGSAEAEDRNIATFFTLLKKYYQTTFDVDYLKGYKDQLEHMGIYVLFVLQDYIDYLTWANSSSQQKLLLNNTESYQGLKDLASLYFDLFDDDNQRDLYATGANLVKEAIEKELWQNSENHYYWQKDSLGNKTDCNWAILYPDAISQLATILNNVNLPELARSATLYDTFNLQQPSWTGTSSYCEMGYVASLMADTTKTQTYQNSIITNIINQNYPPPWDCQEGGYYLLMENRLIELSEIQPIINSPKELGLNFLNSKMLTPFGGLQAQFDNYSLISGTQGVNHEVTSEAISQALLYAALTGNKTFFEEQFEILKNKLLATNQNLLVWKLKPNGQFWANNGQYANASIDDLRAIRALLLANDTFGDVDYLNYAKLLAQGLKEHNIQNGELRKSFGWKPGWPSNEVFLSYIDLTTMKKLAELDSDWENILQTNRKILIGGTVSSGLYYYLYTNGNYFGENYNDNISMIHAGWIAENLARFWKLTGDKDCRAAAEKFLTFAKNEYSSSGKIFGKYNLITGTHTLEYEDTAIYSIVARAAFILGDFVLAKDLLTNKILPLQNKNIKSQTRGCFGYDFENPYAFVCLEALLAKVELETKEEYLIRGKVISSDKNPIEGVILTLSGTTLAIAATDANGEYKFTGEPNGSYTITPSKGGYNFDPKTKQFSPLDRHWDNVDFIGLSGKITYLSPTSGTIGTLIIIKGEGFSGDEDIRISFGEIITLVMITSDALGDFNTLFTAPIQPSGTITISAYGSSSTVIGINYFFLRALDRFSITTISEQTAGEEFTISICALDSRGDIFEYSGTASLTDTSLSLFSPKTMPPFASGRWTGTVTITKVGTTTIKVEAENKIGTSNPFLVNSAQINKLVFITPPQTIIAGTSTKLIIFQTQDRFDNPANTQDEVKIQLLTTSLKGRFSLSPSNWIETNTVTLTSGTNTGWFYYLDTLAGTQTITIKEEPTQGWADGTQCLIVTPASFDHFDFNTITTQQVGQEFQIEMTTKDAFDNLVDFTCIVSLTVNPDIATVTAGRGIASVTITKAGTTTIMANFNDKSGLSNPFYVTPAKLNHFIIGTITSQIAGEPFRVKIEAFDFYGNMATYSDMAYLETGTKTTIVFTQGLWEGTLAITIAGTTTIIVSIEEQRGTSNPFWVSPNVLDHFLFANISSQKVGREFEISITAMDAYENIATYTDIVLLQDTSQTILPTKTASFINGIWQGKVTITKSGTTSLLAFRDYKQGTSNNFFLEAEQLDHFAFATITDQEAGRGFEITIVAKDRYENISPYSDKTQLEDTSGTLIGTLTDNFKDGIWQGIVSIILAGTTCIFANTNGKTGISNLFYVSPDVLNKIKITPDKIELGVGSEGKFSADGYDKYENRLESLIYTWDSIIGSLNPTLGSWTLFKATTTLTTGTLTATWGTIIGYATITLQIGTLSYLIITPSNATMTVGNSMIFTSKGYDNYGNEKFIEGGTWEIDPQMGNLVSVRGTLTTFTAGTKAGDTWIKYYLNSIIGSTTFSILPGTHTYFKIGTISFPQTAGIPFFITITAQDVYNNTIKNYTGEARLNYSAGKIYPEKITNFTSDLWIGTITIEKAADNGLITIQDTTSPTIKGTSNPFSISPNSLARFNISQIPSSFIINTKIPIVVTAEDVYGNIVTDYNGSFNLSDDTQTIYPKVGICTAGEFRGSVSITKAKSKIKLTAAAGDKKGTSNLFTTLIDNELTNEIIEGDTSIKIPLGIISTDFYVIIDSDTERQKTEIDLANSCLSLDQTSLRIPQSLHLFQAYDKDDQPLPLGTNSSVWISLPYPDEDEDGIVDYPDVVIKEKTLKIYELKNNRWVEVKNCRIYPYENIVSASVPRLGVYILVGQIIPANIDILVVYPNPFKPIRGDSEIIFDGLPANSTIRIYDISGSLIREIENITLGTYAWDVKDDYGRNVDSGIYIYIVSNDKERKIGKLAIIR